MAADSTNNDTDFQFQLVPYEDEEAEEALSLCDLPLDNEAQEFHELSSKFLKARCSSSEFFEFFSENSSDSFMCSAEDIIVCGKLIPFKENTPTPQAPKSSSNSKHDYQKKQTGFRRRSESLSGIQGPVTRSNSTKNKIMMTNSRSLDYRKLQRQSSMVSPVPEMERNPSVRSVGSSKSDKKSTSSGKPKWSFLMFGIVKFPAEMDLSDIKSRQVRKNPSTSLFPDTSVGKCSSVSRSNSGNKGSWKLLRALSCKDHASVSVTASYYVAQV
ncbi:uncharacterized protein LOC126792106 [Argentina anserina]|uniref:uncharacterized protein LOC126792106 n=1 Tax=Argentina anserina TaxID=57926 RepID=UPI0021762A4E|nr:uncharacterized protein LOC126792106 [Potentilla anserina]